MTELSNFLRVKRFRCACVSSLDFLKEDDVHSCGKVQVN